MSQGSAKVKPNRRSKRKENMSISMKSMASILILAAASIGLQGCNTFRGAGTDIRKGGEAIEKSSLEAQPQFDVEAASTFAVQPMCHDFMASFKLASITGNSVER